MKYKHAVSERAVYHLQTDLSVCKQPFN